MNDKETHALRQQEIEEGYRFDWNGGAPQVIGHSRGCGLGLAGYEAVEGSVWCETPVMKVDGLKMHPNPMLVCIYLDGPV